METSYDDDDLEPFLSEALDESLPPLDRLGSVYYLKQRETFLSDEHRRVVEAAHERIRRALDLADTAWEEEPPPPPPLVQATLFPHDQ